MIGGTVIFGLLALFVIPRLELHSSMQKAFDRNGKSIIHDYFRSNLKQAKSYLGEPDQIDDLRIEEKVAYWDYDPVQLQLHFHKDRVIRVAYFTDDSSTLEILKNELIHFYESDEGWKIETIQKEGKTEKALINPKRRISLVVGPNGVFVYGYIIKSSEQVVTTSASAPR